MKASAFSLLLFLLIPRAVSAATTTPVDGAAAPVAGLLQVLVALGIVLAAIAAFAWFLRRLTPGSIGSRGWLRIVGGAMVGPKERVVLVEIGDTWLLLGVAASSVSLLHTLPKPAHAPPQEGESAPAGFSNTLLRAIASRRRKS